MIGMDGSGKRTACGSVRAKGKPADGTEKAVLSGRGEALIKLLAFDADDTLWENETRFRLAERRTAEVLRDFCDFETMSKALYDTESCNMEDYGFGAMAFTLSMIQTAVEISKERVSAAQIARIVEIGRELLHNPATPLPGVEECLARLRTSGKYSLVIFTKGAANDQEHKIERSGLMKYFDSAHIVSDKNESEYLKLCRSFGIKTEELLMIGNSFKSDIHPVLEIGAWAIHVPFRETWALEKTEEYEHPRLRRVVSISEIPALLL